MKRMKVTTIGSVLGVALVILVGCASSMVPSNTRNNDAGITSVIQASLEASNVVKEGQVDVETREGYVYLSGVVDTEKAKVEAGKIAAGSKGVKGLANRLTVGEETLGGRIDDVVISSKVKSMLIADSKIKAGDIDVSSSLGVVTLIGRVSSIEIKDDAERIARSTNGVTDVNNELLVGELKP